MNTIPPDEHLLKALQHAPDAGVVPPHEVSAQILAAAHRSAAQLRPAAVRASPAWRRWAAALWHRPGASAALASVLLAGFVGLLWRGEVPGPASDEPSSQPALAAAVKRSDGSMGSSLPAAALGAGTRVLPATAPGPGLANAVLPEKAAAPPPPRPNATRRAAGNATPALGPVLQTQPAEIAPVQPDLPSAPERPAPAEARSRPPQTPAAPVPAAPPPSPAAAAPAPPPMTSTATAAGRTLRGAAAGAPAPAATAALRETAAPLAAADAVSAPPWQSLTSAGDRWRWQPGGELRDPDAAWWAALAGATQGRWQVATDAEPATGSVRLDGQRGPERVGRLWLEPAGALWCGAAPPCQRAPLAAESRRELLDRLAR